MRLIDANKYPCRDCGITNCQSKCITYYKWLNGCDYDVEKVVEKIQKKHCKRCRNILSILGAEVYCKEQKCQIEELCEIVRKGGVE